MIQIIHEISPQPAPFKSIRLSEQIGFGFDPDCFRMRDLIPYFSRKEYKKEQGKPQFSGKISPDWRTNGCSALTCILLSVLQ